MSIGAAVESVIVLQVDGNLTATTDIASVALPFDGEIVAVNGFLGTAAGAAATDLDVNVGGTSIFGALSKPSFAATSQSAGATSYPASGILGKFNAGDVISVDADAVGNTPAPADLTIAISYKADTNPY